MLLHRWQTYWHALFYATLLAATVIGASAEDHAARRVLIGVLAALLAVWYWYAVVRARRFEVGAGSVVLLDLAIATALWVPLLLWQDAFLLLMFSAYALACSAPVRRAVPGLAVVSAIIVATDSARHGRVEALDVALYAAVTVALSLLAVMMHAVHEQSEQRRRLIEELDATRSELAASERRAGTLAERERLARDIHDTLAQGFASIVTLTEAARAEFAAHPYVARQHLEAAGRQARASLDEARHVVWALRPDALERGGLAGALERIAADFRAETGIDARSVVSGVPGAIGADAEADLLRVAQEALANVRKHAAARRVALTLTYLDDAVLLDIRDDGQGFDAASPRAGFGLTGMRERIDRYGATLTVESEPGQGTTIVACLPSAPAPVR